MRAILSIAVCVCLLPNHAVAGLCNLLTYISRNSGAHHSTRTPLDQSMGDEDNLDAVELLVDVTDSRTEVVRLDSCT